MVRVKAWDPPAGVADPGTVGDAMTKEVVAVLPGATLADAARELERADVSGGPVVEEGQVVGVVTLRDLVSRAPEQGALAATTGPFHRVERLLAAESARTGLRVRDVMSRAVRTVTVDTPISEAAAVMVRAGINRLPVVNAAGRPVGILTRDDVLAAVARLAEPETARRPLLPPD